MANRRWSSELGSGQRRGIVPSGAVQPALPVVASADIRRRPEENGRAPQQRVGGPGETRWPSRL